jgi:hypothetical protein
MKRTLAVGFAGALALTAASPAFAQRVLGPAPWGFGVGVTVGDYDAYAYAPGPVVSGPGIVVESGDDAYAADSDAIVVQRSTPSAHPPDHLPQHERNLRGTDY